MLKSLNPYISHIIFTVVLLQLIFAVYWDLVTAKFPNKFFLIFTAFNFVLFIFLHGLSGLSVSVMSFGVAIILLAPIYFTKILGGGDVKLILAISPLLLMDEFITFLLMSFLWAGVFGLMKALLGGNLRSLLANTLFTAKKIRVAEESLPFTVGILLGWCSYKSILGLGLI